MSAHLTFFWRTGTAGIPGGDSEAEDAAKLAGLLAKREGSAIRPESAGTIVGMAVRGIACVSFWLLSLLLLLLLLLPPTAKWNVLEQEQA